MTWLLSGGVWSDAGEWDDASVWEDGAPPVSVVAYGSDEGFSDWLAGHGYTLPVGSPGMAVLRARGSLFVDAYEPRWTGRRAEWDQDLGWPRVGATVGCVAPVPEGVIPPSVVRAAYRAAYLEAVTPGVLTQGGGVSGQRVLSEQVDVLKVTYADDGAFGASSRYFDPLIDSWLSAFICDAGDSPFIFESFGS